MKKPGLSDIKTLFALSGNVCAFHDEDRPGGACEQQLADPTWERVMGEICHIYGEKPGAARYDPAHEHDGHEGWNLILLCPRCHTVIDQTEPGRFPVEKLMRMKDRAVSTAETTQLDLGDALDAIAAGALATLTRLMTLEPRSPLENPGTLTPEPEPDQEPDPPTDPERFVTVADAAQRLGITAQAVRQQIQRGTLLAEQDDSLGRTRIKIREVDLNDAIDRRRIASPSLTTSLGKPSPSAAPVNRRQRRPQGR